MSKLARILLIFALILSCSNIFAYGTQASITKYQVVILKVEFSPDATGDNWRTAAEGSQIVNPTMDICSANFNEKVATFCQNLTLPVGTYVRCKLTISQTFVLNGTVTYGVDTYKTKTNPPSLTTGNAEDSTINNPAGNYEQIVSGNLTIIEGQTTTMRVIMNTNNVIELMAYGVGQHIIVPKEPSWTFTQ